MDTNGHEEEKKEKTKRLVCFSFVSYWCPFVSIRGAIFLLFLTSPIGCIFGHPKPATMPIERTDVVGAQPDYWWNQPTVAQVQSTDFQKLWDACKGELYVRLFELDREQYRDGLMTSVPIISKQFFEPWRSDTGSVHDTAESSTSTLRRTVHFEVTRRDDGVYEMSPKVLIERYASAERRLTAITQYHSAFNAPRATADEADQSGQPIASDYWYPVRRDGDLEKAMAASIQNRLSQ